MGDNSCNTTQYYLGIDPESTPISTIADKISNHNVLSYSDCWDAIKNLDEDPQDSSNVILIYSQRSEPKSTSGVSTGWNREHVWAKSYGVGSSGPDYSDLYHLFPADWNVNSARGNKLLGDCQDSDCISPAHAEAASDTASNATFFDPPNSVKGDLARALMYMALRYDGSRDSSTENLTVSECPCQYDYTSPALLSTLLQWHENDPVDDRERNRTDTICRLYQGNRNPFVDLPSLASRIFGNVSSSCQVCEESTVNTSPTTEEVDTTTTDVNMGTQCDSRPNLYFSAYSEGTSYNKLVEIWNPTNTSFRMLTGGFQLNFCYNGCSDYESEYDFESDIVLAPFESLIMCHSSFDVSLLPNGMTCDVMSSRLSFNGNDLIALTCTNSTGTTTVLDTIGDVTLLSSDTGWPVCDMTGSNLGDVTIIRDCMRDGGTSDWSTSRNCQWSVFENSVEGLDHLYRTNSSRCVAEVTSSLSTVDTTTEELTSTTTLSADMTTTMQQQETTTTLLRNNLNGSDGDNDTVILLLASLILVLFVVPMYLYCVRRKKRLRRVGVS